MADEWQTTSLGDLIDVKHGFAFQGEFIHDEPRGDILLTPGNFAIGGGFKGDKFKYYDGPIPDEFVLHEGDLLVSMTDLSKQSDTLGLPAFVPARDDKRRYLHNQRLGKIIIRDKEKLDVTFLHYLLCNDSYRHEILASATGTTVKHTSPDRIKRFRFVRPPFDEQRAIARILAAFDHKVETNRKLSETLRGIARTIFESWFIDFDPVRAKMQGRDPGIAADIAALFPKELVPSADKEIPKGWFLKPLSSLGRFLNGLALQKFPAEGDKFLPVIKIAELRAGRWTNGDKASTSIPNEYVVDDGDMLFSWSGSLLHRFWCGGRGALNQHLFKVTPLGVSAGFLYESIGQHIQEFQAIAADKATTMGHIQRRHLDEAMVAVAPAGLMDRAGEILDLFHKRALLGEKQSRILAAIRDLLLPKLMSGEVHANDAERLIGQAAV